MFLSKQHDFQMRQITIGKVHLYIDVGFIVIHNLE